MKKGKVFFQEKLLENQNDAFNSEYVTQDHWDWLAEKIKCFVDVEHVFNAIDVGGGNGLFVDRMLNYFLNARIYNIDLSSSLLSKNSMHSRKFVIEGSIFDYSPDGKFDVISMNWVLHHLVGKNFRSSDELVCLALDKVSSMLSENGLVIVFENVISGLFNDNLSSRLLYYGTSNRILSSVTRRLGANTAGVGVYYMGRSNLLKKFASVGLNPIAELEGRMHSYGWRLWPILAQGVVQRCFILRRA